MGKYVGQRCGDYRLTTYLGQGGFAEVYLGEHLFDQGKKAAVKILKRGFSPEEMEEFRSEAQTITHLRHSRIVQLSAFGEAILNGERIPFLVMDYAPHGSLDKRHPRGSKLPLKTIIVYMKQLAEALQFAHEQQIVHRDIKPANFLLGEDEKALLSDFGIAILAHQNESWVEQKLAGSWHYAAPEHFDGKAVPASDQYSLGVVVYQWLCGELPFQGGFLQLTRQHHLVPPPPLHEKIPITPLLEKTVMRALSKEPEQRFPSVQDFVFALDYVSQEEMTASKGNVSIGTTQLIYGGLTSINTLAWSPDGTYITAASRECAVQVWDAHSGKMLGLYDKNHLPNALKGRSGWKHCYSPDGQSIALLSHDGALSFKKVTGDETHSRSYSNSDRLTWSPDGRCIACIKTETNTAHSRYYSQIEAILIRDIIKGTIICTCRERSPSERLKVKTAEWSPDGQYIAASYDDETVRIWDAIRGKRLRLYQGASVRRIAWSPDGQHIASDNYDESTIDVWNPFDGMLLSTYHYDKHFGQVSDLIWSPDAQYIVLVYYQHIHVFNSITGKIIFSAEQTQIKAIAWSPDGTLLASGSANGEVRVWNPIIKGATFWTNTNDAHSSQVHGLAWSPNSLLLVSESVHDKVRVWGSKSGKTYCTRPLHQSNRISWKTSIWSPDGTRVASRTGGYVEIWNPTNATRISISPEHAVETWMLPLLPQTSLNGMAWSPDGQHTASANPQNGTVNIQSSINKGQILPTYRGHTSTPLRPQVVAWSPDGQRIASTDPSDRTIHVWNPTNGKPICIYHGYSEQVSALIWSPDSEHIVSFGLDKKDIYVWNSTRGETCCIYAGHQTPALSSQLWSSEYAGHQTPALSSQPPIQTLIWSSDGQCIASVGYQDKAVHLWNPTDGTTIYIYREHISPVQSLAWSPDGKHIASAGNEVRIWQAM